MKHISLITLALLLFAACGNRPAETAAPQAEEQTTKVIHLTKADFITKVFNYETATEWKYLGDKPAVIDFYAIWCGPCKVMSPILDELSVQYADSIYFYKIDVDKEQELSAAFGIRSIPTLFFIPLSGTPQVLEGALPKEDVVKMIQQIQ
ncbi:MAG: thioredoxin [Prevotellaceae bacterium]|nr:thioredoxin [Prevotellaceae bacterium]